LLTFLSTIGTPPAKSTPDEIRLTGAIRRDLDKASPDLSVSVSAPAAKFPHSAIGVPYHRIVARIGKTAAPATPVSAHREEWNAAEQDSLSAGPGEARARQDDEHGRRSKWKAHDITEEANATSQH
jgi:hypothetical protein